MQPLTTPATQIIVDRAIEAITRTKLSFEGQMAIDDAVTEIAELRGWSRKQAATILHVMAWRNQ